tara:strand:- start:686 stop:2722 length:2037 start_codon:yes stop_codon:yes gene_type:complete
MAKQGIGTGSAANDGTGDSLRSAAGKINANFDEVYALLRGGGNSGSTLLAGIVTSIVAGDNVTLTGGPTGIVTINSAAGGGVGYFQQNVTGINTTGSLSNIGIGTTTASSKLTVDGTVKITGITTIDSSLQQTGTATFSDDVTLTGDSANVFWDKSQNQLEFADNAKAIFGTGTDLQIYHNGQDSYIQDSGTGDIIIYGSGETLARFKDDGGVTLFHNDIPQFDTVGSGVSVINQISVGATATFDAKVITGTGATVGFGSTAYFKDDAKLSFGAGGDLEIHHDGSHSYIKDTKSAGSLYLQSSNLLINNQANNATMIKAESGSSVELYYAGTKTFETSTLGIKVSTGATVQTNGAAAFAGIVTASGGLRVGSAVTIGINNGNAGFTGIVTANKFIGDGSGLTGVTGSGSGVVIKNSGSTVGTAGTINFGDNLTVTPIHLGIVTVTASGGNNVAGIDTTAGSTFTNLKATGITTLTGALDANGGATIDNIQIGVTGNNELDTASGNLTIDSAGGQVVIDDYLRVSGVATLSSNVNISGVTTSAQFSATGTNSGLMTSRYEFTGTTAAINNNGIGNTEFSGYKSYALIKVGLSTAGWLRLYTDDASRSDDSTRSVGEDPIAGSGVIAEAAVSAGSTTLNFTPYALGGNAGSATTVFAAITNQSGVTTTFNYSITLLQLEV